MIFSCPFGPVLKDCRWHVGIQSIVLHTEKGRSSLLVLQIVLHGLNTDVFKITINSFMALIYINSSTTLSLFLLVLVAAITVTFSSVQWDQNTGFYNFFSKSLSFSFFSLSSQTGMHYHSMLTRPFIHKARVVSQNPDSQHCIWILMLLKLSVAQLCCPCPPASQRAHFTTHHLSRDDKYDQYDFLPFKWLLSSLLRFPVHRMSEQNEGWCLEVGFLLSAERLQLHASQIRI